MKEKFMALTQKAKSKAKFVVSALVASVVTSIVTLSSNATTPSLNFVFDAQEMFNWTNMLLTALMPVVYITMGVSLAFLIVSALKRAFA